VAILSAAVVICVLPALLAVLGERVNALAPPELQRGRPVRRWYVLAKRVMRHPVPIATIVVLGMIAAGLPFLRAELTRADSRVLPEDSSSRQVDAVIRSDFESNPSDQMLVLVEAGPGARAEARRTARDLVRHSALGGFDEPRRLDGLVTVSIGLNAPPYSDRALDAVEKARDANWGGPARVTGRSAELIDQRASLDANLPLAIAIAVLSSMLILLVMTRSLILPIVSLVMNALTVSVAFGALVLIFQDGRLEGTFDYMSYGALDTSMPILLFALAFGLSTDYGVFLLQRISEARASGLPNEEAIAVGLERSGRIITAAALLFAVAMGAFVFSELIFLKEVAVGTAIAVLVDATIVRALLFPSVLALLGERAWWGPAALQRRSESPIPR
jgi:RND superfamily putative drug exporter